MKLWVDDVRPAPDGYIWLKSVNEAKLEILKARQQQTMFLNDAQYKLNNFDLQGYKNLLSMASRREIELIDMDHDAGEYVSDGGDYIKLLDWFEETGCNYPIHIHSQNVVGRMNMEAICRRNGWTIVD